MHQIGQHVCTLSKQPSCARLAPTASSWRHAACRLRRLTLPCAWHRGAAATLRSRANIAADGYRVLDAPVFLLHPYSPFVFCWQCFVMVVWTISCVYLPVIGFTKVKDGGSVLSSVANIIGLLDMLINFRTGYEDANSKEIILQPRKIALFYFKKRFIFDLMGVIPFRHAYQIWPPPASSEKYPVGAICFIPNVMRFVTLQAYWTTVQKQLNLSYATTVISTCILQTLFFLHWLTFIYMQIPIFMIRFRNNKVHVHSWLHLRNVNLKRDGWLGVYASSLYYATALAIGTGHYNPVNAEHLIEEVLMSSFIALLGLIFFSYTIMALIRLGMHANYQVYSYNGKLKELEQYMINEKLPSHLQKKIILHVKNKYEGNFFREDSIMNTLSQQMKQDIHVYCCSRLLANVPLFMDTPKDFCRNIVCNLKLQAFLPGELLMQHGQPTDSMHFISRGTVAVLYPNGREVAHLAEGAHFGEGALLSPGRAAAVSVVALEVCEVYRLDANDLYYCVSPYPHLRRRMEELAAQRQRAESKGFGAPHDKNA